MAFFYQPESRQPFLRAPAIVLVVIALLVGIEAVREFFFLSSTPELFFRFGLVPARYSAAFLQANQIDGGTLFDRAIPFISYMFLHAGWTHVAVNSIWLLPFGSLIARRYGGVLFAALFLICGVAGAVVHLVCNWGSMAPVVGASAAVSGLMGLAFRIMLAGPDQALAPLFGRQVLLWSAFWIIVNVVAGLTGLGTGPGIQLVAWQAHIGGYFAGLLLAGPADWLRRRELGRKQPGAAA
jgi:membrane associated rhomboid family serine protease